jgi:hypothetical protein
VFRNRRSTVRHKMMPAIWAKSQSTTLCTPSMGCAN